MLGRDFDAILVGAFGDPRVKTNTHAKEILLGLRFKMDLYANVRPVRLLGDVKLFLLHIAGDLDDLHPVAQRRRNCLHHIRRGDKHHFREVERNLEVVIAERKVLLRVEDLQERRRRITTELLADLVDFVEHEHRIVGSRLFQPLDDASGERADICTTVAADFGLIMDAAERDTDKISAKGVRNGTPQGGFPHSRRSYESENRPTHVVLQLANRQVFEDPALHFVDSIMILLEDLPRVRDVQSVLRRNAPWKVKDRFNVIV